MTGAKKNPLQYAAGVGQVSAWQPRANPATPLPGGLPVLIVSGELEYRLRFATAVHLRGLRPVCRSNVKDSRALLAHEKYSLAFCSEVLSDGDYGDVVHAASCSWPRVPVIVFSHMADWSAFLRAVSTGACDYISVPGDAREAGRVLVSALSLVSSLDRPTGAKGASA